jgi:hypothetical protein
VGTRFSLSSSISRGVTDLPFPSRPKLRSTRTHARIRFCTVPRSGPPRFFSSSRASALGSSNTSAPSPSASSASASAKSSSSSPAASAACSSAASSSASAAARASSLRERPTMSFPLSSSSSSSPSEEASEPVGMILAGRSACFDFFERPRMMGASSSEDSRSSSCAGPVR